MFDIEYSILKFVIIFEKKCKIGKVKNSALRGVLGQSLIESSCIFEISKMSCDACKYARSCALSELFYSKLDGEFEGISNTTIPSYIIQCNEEKEYIDEGETLNFNIVIFNRGIPYINLIIESLRKYGKIKGINGVKYNVIKVMNINGDNIFNDGKIKKDKIIIDTINSYIKNKTYKDSVSLEFITPFRHKKNKEFTKILSLEDIIKSIYNRIIMLNALQGNKIDFNNYNLERKENEEIYYSKGTWSELKRFSNKQKKLLAMGGIVGKITIKNPSDKLIKILVAGEVLQVGKNTSFGLGQYKLR